MRKFYVVGNLKMNLSSREETDTYLSVLRREAKGKRFEHTLGILCPPVPYLEDFRELPAGMKSGAQDIFWEKSGAYTGAVSPLMVKNDGAEYVIIGHSERRQYFGETDETIRLKAFAAEKHRLVPIVCIGETAEERRAEETARVIERQLKNLFQEMSKLQAEKIILAYEPRWAVGTDSIPTTADILQVKVLIRKTLSGIFDGALAEKIAVIYGGSVKSAYLGAVSWEAELDGVLVGRESLFPYEVIKMMQLGEEQMQKTGSV